MVLSCSLEKHTLPLASTRVSLVSVTVCEWLAVLQQRSVICSFILSAVATYLPHAWHQVTHKQQTDKCTLPCSLEGEFSRPKFASWYCISPDSCQFC